MISTASRKLILKTIGFIIICLCLMPKSACIKKQYFSLERPKITFVDPEYFCNVVIKSRLKSRANPIHYVDFNITNLKTLDNTYKATATFYQLLSNVYKPSFVELSMYLCDAIEKDIIIFPAIIEGYNRMPKEARPMPGMKCPVIPGNYSFTNMVIPINNIPTAFPFKDGRIFFKVARGKTILINVHIDFQLKTIDL